MTKTCAIIGCSPMCFPWGFDEEDEGCAAIKLLLMNRITQQRAQGIEHFAIAIDRGIGLYAAEIVAGLQSTDPQLEMTLYAPCEGQASKWMPELRDRYFAVHQAAKEIRYACREWEVGCEFSAYLHAICSSDQLLAIYDPRDPACEREAAAVHTAQVMGRGVLLITPPIKGLWK